MRWSGLTLAAGLVVAHAAAAPVASERTGSEHGITVLVVGGIHGNEPAPPHAVRALEEVDVRRGKLVLLPEANPKALAARSRHTPGARFLDVNRNFPIASRPEPRGPLATELWRFAKRTRPDWVIDVHEGFDFNRRNPKSVGSSVTWVPHRQVGACSARLARSVVDHMNESIEDESRHFTLLAPGPEGSFARSITESLGIPSLVLETTRALQPLEVRVAQHRRMLAFVLDQLAVTSPDAKRAPCITDSRTSL